MLNQERVLELTESYLKSLIADAGVSVGRDFDSSAPFGELGVDSFRVLKIIKTLEADFGTLPKTLLFENFNVESLARYFTIKHADALRVKLGQVVPNPDAVLIAAIVPLPQVLATQPASAIVAAVTPYPAAATVVSAHATAVTAAPAPLLLLESDLNLYPELEAQLLALYECYKNEGCVSRGTRNIAPNLFVGSARCGYFNYGRSGKALLVYAYTGPQDYFDSLASEMLAHCHLYGLQLNLFTDVEVAKVGGVPFTSTPFGALQRVHDLRGFSLEGGAMRRLRYQVAKFEKAGNCHTLEYECGTDAKVDRDIARVIDLWCETKPMVNPLVHLVRGEILAGSLHPQHRIFLTYIDNALQNVILISKLCRDLNGHLMDLEFYSRDMPLGGLEYAIVRIVEALASEGCDLLSLGGTYGVRLGASANADPNVDRILDDLHRQNIFNDEGNLQFKNKFRPENRTIYLCRPVGSGAADNIIDIIMMIADPAKQTSDENNHNAATMLGVHAPPAVSALLQTQTQTLTSAPAGTFAGPEEALRAAALSGAGYNPLNLTADAVEFDLKTDSWAQLETAYVARQMAHLRSQLQQPANLNDSLRAVFPFRHFVLTDAGRSADDLFCRAWTKKGLVVQNLLFPTCLYHQIDKGFEPFELPHPALFDPASSELYKSNLSWDGLQSVVAQRAQDIAYVCIEVSDNAGGGMPVSLAHLREVKALLSTHGIALVIDATRILENAQFLITHESECAGRSLWEVARAMLSLADATIGSLAKDFCIDKGGLIATDDEELARRLLCLQQEHGGGLDVIDRKLIALALQNRRQIETWIRRRVQATATLWRMLHDAGVPVVGPVGGHCVLIDVKRIDALDGIEQPVAVFLAWLYRSTGVRAGAHSVGMQKNTAINDLVRLAVPVGLKQDEVEEIAARIVHMFAAPRDIPELMQSEAHSSGESFARFALRNYLFPSTPFAASPAPVPLHSPVEIAMPNKPGRPAAVRMEPVLTEAPRMDSNRNEIAIVGMAGRYPKAKNLHEFWENLREGRDCTGPLPEERIARRLRNDFTTQYRGGFIDEVDRFDSLFFNISPREAEVLDPQERLFLEVAWETLEDAGYYPDILAQDGKHRNVGVFVGAVWAMYQMIGVEEKLAGNNLNPNSFLWSVANRVSYWMNLTGPSLTVDTACSSSLTALYLACEAIRNGHCDSAIVGGVNLDLHQHKFDINWAGGALSPDGVCRSFGADANGYVAGEGVGAVFIKSLQQALDDNDQIYSVIRGATSNHGGRTSGYTVPNPKAQGDLIATALIRAGVDARSIGYIEAHGTGTELGDPVEISGLNTAFEAWRVPNGSCAIGSVKTNIGHLEAAAGVVGLCKAVLQIKHRQLVPSLHSARINEHIDFVNSPFYVQQSLKNWHQKDVDGVRMPLRAGISSFGAGGANAHVIVEDYPLRPSDDALPPGGTVFPLSARSDEQLREMAQRLRTHLEHDGLTQALCDVAFTLQNGRKSFDHRVAIVADGRHDLIDKLGAFVEGRRHDDVLTGNARNADGITKLLSRSEKEQFVSLLSQSRDPHKMAQLWLDGLLSDCRGLLHAPARRTSLPTYPFADKRHWIGTLKAPGSTLAVGARGGLHPLIDSNVSTFQRQLFRKSFRAQEFFLRDHVVSSVPTLPGTAYLDMARMAGEAAAGRKVRKIRNVTWISPLTAEGAVPTEATIELKPGADAVAFEIFSEASDGRKKLYAQGKLVYDADGAAEPEAEYLDLEAIRARCVKVIDGRDAYPLFKSVGMEYGPSFQVLDEVFKSDDEVLGLLRLPGARSSDFDDFVLHPCLLDASMQAGVVGQLGDKSGDMKVPYSIGEVELLHPLTRTCYSYVTKMKNERSGSSGLSRENVTIVDENGRVLARIRESVGVPLTSVHEKPAASKHAELTQNDGEFAELYYAHSWRQAPVAQTQSDVRALLLFDTEDAVHQICITRRIDVVLVQPGAGFEDLGEGRYRLDPGDRAQYARLFETLAKKSWVADKICYAWPRSAAPADADALQQALALGVYGFLLLNQALLDQKPSGRVQIAYLYRTQAGTYAPHNDAINGFIRSMRLEHPKIDAKALDVRGARADATLDALLAELHAANQDDITVRYDNGARWVRALKKLDASELQPNLPGEAKRIALKQHGVYVVTGGAGGLGLIFAEYLAQACSARLVLTGRSTLPPEREAQLEALRAHGADVLYVAADISVAADARRVLDATRARFGRIDGIVHSAGVLRDSYLRKKTKDEMRAVLAPKVFGTHHLDALTCNDDLDFFASFSSLAAIGGNAGQCDYAFANHYMDSFAEAREALRAKGLRRGRTLSLNWSLWAEGGMKLDEQTDLFFRRTLGIKPLDTDVGLAAFVAGLALDRPHLAILQGQQAKIELAWGLVKKQPAAVVLSTASPITGGDAIAHGGNVLNSAVIEALSRLAMDMLMLSMDELDLDSILLDLGFDSIGLATFANAINDRYVIDINPVLFFEYPSINAIAGVLVAEHETAVRKVHGDMVTMSAVATLTVDAAGHVPPVSAHYSTPIAINKGWNQGPGSRTTTGDGSGGDFSLSRRFLDMPIAIVGIAGVMPQSENVEVFWDNLRNERNLVTEIPRDRWMWEDYDGNPHKEVNKSNSKWGGFMKEVDKFDPLFFGILPREAEMMDPQQRIFIETVWSAIEDGGHKVSDLSGTKTGVFVGASAKDYIDVMAENQSSLDGFSASGNSHSILANRISFLFNLRGPSAPLDTACSSSLVALHRAIESIHTGSSDMAIVGGVQVMLTPVAHVALSMAGMLSIDGKCKTFDKDANGYVRGEGVGAILIKPLAHAERDGNPIYAVIKATAENHGGRMTMLTAPNPKAQAELLYEAYEKGGVDPATVGYIECHGTGTSLGDPIEIQALKKSFANLYRKHDKPAPTAPHCGLSSVKTNIGHLEPAAGMAGLLKVLMAIRHRCIPAMLHFQQLNPYIDLKGSPFYIVDKTVDWPAPLGSDGLTKPRCAGVSSFGWGGANAHVVLEEYLPPARTAAPPAGPYPIMLSAKNADRLKVYASTMAERIARSDMPLSDIAYTLQVGRDPMQERLAFLAESTAHIVDTLRAFANDVEAPEVFRGKAGRSSSESATGSTGDAVRPQDVDGWSALLQRWVRGEDVDWGRLYAGAGLRRLNLPTYPFARERSWIALRKAQQSAAPAQTAHLQSQPQETSTRLPLPMHDTLILYSEHWQPQPQPQPQPQLLTAASTTNVQLVIFAEAGMAGAFAAEVGSADAVIVQQGDAFAKHSDRMFQCPDAYEDLLAVLNAVHAESQRSLTVVYGWARGNGRAGVHGIFRLLQAVKAAQGPVARVALVGSYDPQRVDTCWDYAWIGFERSLRLYLAKTQLSVQLSDVPQLDAHRYVQAIADIGAVRYRNGLREVLTYAPCVPEQESVGEVLRPGGGYLITGGCGALGMRFAHRIAERCGARLLLVGRSPMSPQIAAKLDALRQAGAVDAQYRALDIGERAAVMAMTEALPFEIHGILHAAGIESSVPFHQKYQYDIDRVLSPKTDGTILLDEAFVGRDLDFVCYFSSSSAMLGDFGACDYAVGNRFQIAYGMHRRLRGYAGRTVTINWPLWDGGGMGVVDPEQSALYLKRTGLRALRSDEGLALWERLLRSSRDHTLVLCGDPVRITALLDKLYGVSRAAPPAAARSVAAKKLSPVQIDALKALIKTELLNLQTAGH